MSHDRVPENFHSLHRQEEYLRSRAIELIADNSDLALHLAVAEIAMDLTDLLRQVPSDDEDFKVVQILGIRIFNAFGASLKLAMSGYSQNSALLMRDILETVFLMDMFRKDRSAIQQWREAKSAKESICVSSQGASGSQGRFSLTSVLARMTSFRMTAVRASFGFLPLSFSLS